MFTQQNIYDFRKTIAFELFEQKLLKENLTCLECEDFFQKLTVLKNLTRAKHEPNFEFWYKIF